MRNRSLICLTQELPTRLAGWLQRMRSTASGKAPARIPIIENIDHFPTNPPKERHALLMLAPEAWLAAVEQYPDIRLFNYYGLTYEIVKALNEHGYKVDIADLTSELVPNKRYDLFIGHGGRCRTIIDNLLPECVIFQYVSGAYWKGFNEESRQRYDRFAKSRGITAPDKFRRDLSELLEGEEYLLHKADCLFTLNCPRMIATFGDYRSKFFFTAFGAYIDPVLFIPPDERQHEHGRTNFIYVGGTGGNIQKGMDVLIEAFASTPELHLFIYCKVEDEVTRHYRKELALPNIHYVYHYRYSIFSNSLKRLMRRISFSVHAPINTGMGTAFMGTMGLGLIPVGYVDLEDDPECTVLTSNWDVESIAACIRRAAGKDATWCENASSKIIRVHEKICGTASLRASFNQLFSDGNVTAVRQRRNAASVQNRPIEPAPVEFA